LNIERYFILHYNEQQINKQHDVHYLSNDYKFIMKEVNQDEMLVIVGPGPGVDLSVAIGKVNNLMLEIGGY